MNRRFFKYFLTCMTVALILAAAGCGDQGKTVKDNTIDPDTVPNKATETEVASSGYFLWSYCPFECEGICQMDPCGPPPDAPPRPNPPTDCNEANIIAWLKKDKTFEKLIDEGDLEVAFSSDTNILDLKGKIHGDDGSIGRFHGILRSHFLGRKPPIKTGDPCILSIRYSKK